MNFCRPFFIFILLILIFYDDMAEKKNSPGNLIVMTIWILKLRGS